MAAALRLGGNEVNPNDPPARGRHYQLPAIPSWRFIAANDLGYFEGSVVERIVGWQHNGGVADLRKARQTLDRLIELETADVDPDPTA